jgi:hypothetical protein
LEGISCLVRRRCLSARWLEPLRCPPWPPHQPPAAMFFDRGILLVRECLLRIQRMLILQSTVLICFIVGEF